MDFGRMKRGGMGKGGIQGQVPLNYHENGTVRLGLLRRPRWFRRKTTTNIIIPYTVQIISKRFKERWTLYPWIPELPLSDGKSPTDMIIPPFNFKIMLEANPLKSRTLVSRRAVMDLAWLIRRPHRGRRPCIYIYIYIYMCIYTYICI